MSNATESAPASTGEDADELYAAEDVGDADGRLWRALVIDKSGEDWEEVGFTLLWGNRSLAAEAAHYYKLANLLEEAGVATYPYEGECKQVGVMERNDREHGIYLGFDDGEPLDHEANCLQYKDHLTTAFDTV